MFTPTTEFSIEDSAQVISNMWPMLMMYGVWIILLSAIVVGLFYFFKRNRKQVQS